MSCALRLSLVAAALLSGAVAAGVGTVRAEPRQLYVDGAFTPQCEPLRDCPGGSECSGASGTCGMVGETARLAPTCHQAHDSYLCCDADPDCVVYDADGTEMDRGRCITTLAVDTVPGVCQFGSDVGPSFCGDVGGRDAEALLQRCLSEPGSMVGVLEWAEGDCDDDGVSNGDEWSLDCPPCDPTVTPSDGICPMPLFVDAGVSAPDAGPEPDAGAARDAGRPPPAPTDDFRFQGGGGCSCRATGDGPATAGHVLALALAVLLAGRRRGR